MTQAALSRPGAIWRYPPLAEDVPLVEGAPEFSEEAACERLRELFDEGVRLRLMADAPLGAFLSGGFLFAISRQTGLEHYFFTNYAPHLLRKRLLKPDWMLPADGAYLTRIFVNYLPVESAGTLSQALHFEATNRLAGDMLVKVDRISMAASLEVRCPLLDYKLAEFAATIPNNWKLRNEQGKHILLRALGDRLPHELLHRKKMGFAIPIRDWLNSPLRDMIRDLILGQSFLSRGIVSPSFVQHLLREHETGRRD
jgi:asparagine synthase (glutamine-hydrolysing)